MGTGIGMAIAANRHAGIRAAVLHDSTEARLTRAHNNANVACFGARTVGVEAALDALDRGAIDHGEGGAQDLVPRLDLAHGALQRIGLLAKLITHRRRALGQRPF